MLANGGRQENIVQVDTSQVPDDAYTKLLFNEFMSKLTSRGLIRRVPFRHIKIVFFNFLTAIGRSQDDKINKDLLFKYLAHFNRSNVDNERRFALNDQDFKRTSELLDQLIFSYLSDHFAGASQQFPRPTVTQNFPHFPTRPSLQPITPKMSTTRQFQDKMFALPSLEESSTQEPLGQSTASFGGVASNTARPTTKSVLAELEFPSNHDRIKYQFMHDPELFKMTRTTTRSTRRSTTRTTTRSTTKSNHYPQLFNSGAVTENAINFRPNFNNQESTQTTRADPLSGLFSHSFTTNPPFTTTWRATTTPTPKDISSGQWDQILNKLNFALEKLSNLENNMDPDILDNPQYVNTKGKLISDVRKNLTDVVVNVVSYDEEEFEDDSIDYKDYFQAIVDTDNLSLDRSPTTTTTSRPEDDYFYLYEDLLKVPEGPLPGVGNKNPVPLSEFPTDTDAIEESRPFPINVPIPLTESEKLGLPSLFNRPEERKPVNIGIPANNNERVNTRSKLTVPSIIQLLFGRPTNMSEIRQRVPDFTSSGPVNIPSSIQLYGDIGKYLNKSTTRRPFQQGEIPTLQHAEIPSLQHAEIPKLSHHLQHAKIPQQISHYLHNLPKEEEKEEIVELNGEPLKLPPKNRIDGSLLATLVEALEQNERVKLSRPATNIPTSQAPSRLSFNLPSNGALPKPQSLAALEALGRQPQPLPIKWKDEMPLPTQRLPPFHKETLAPNRRQEEMLTLPAVYQNFLKVTGADTPRANVDSLLQRFSQSPFDSKVHRFKSPPMMLPLEGSDDRVTEDPFTILQPQSLSRPFRVANTPTARSSNSDDTLLDMILRQKFLSKGRMKRSSNFILEPPADLADHIASNHKDSDVQLRPEDAVVNILLNRPQVSTSSTTTTTKSTTLILSKPSAIESAELTVAKPQIFNQIGVINGVQSSLLGFPNPFITSTSSGTISYNKLAIAAALSIIPTLVIAFPFMAPSLGKRRRRKK